MKNIYIISHFYSSNLGDRNQGRIFADIFGNKENITYINFNDTTVQYDESGTYEITSPNNITEIKCDIAIFLIGSFNGHSNYVTFLKRIQNECPDCKIFVWGGFTCVNNINNDTTPFSNLEIFKE